MKYDVLMPTNWNKIREIVNTVIDTCEQVEHLSEDENKRSKILNTDKKITVSDLLTSLHTYPENLSYSIIRSRHDLQQSKAYTSDTAHALINTAKLCSELLEFDNYDSPVSLDNRDTSVNNQIDAFLAWHKEHVPALLAKQD